MAIIRGLMSGKKIGICGVGVVGGALLRYLEKQGEVPIIYDKQQLDTSKDALKEADVVFICVPTPFREGKGFDISAVEEAIGALGGNKVVVIRSTVVPGTTDKLQARYQQHKILVNPEFLREAHADEDMLHPERQIVGYTDKSRGAAQGVLDLLPRAPFERLVEAKVAEMVKYTGNAFLSTKVIFANQIYDLCEKLGIDYDKVKEAVSKDPRIGASHLDVLHGGYRGYGGKCLDKDIKALIELADSVDVNVDLYKKVVEINEALLKAQGIERADELQ